MAKQKAAKRALDIGRVLRAIDVGDKTFYKGLTEEERKEFEPFVVMRFASAIDRASTEMQQWYLLMVNNCVNRHFGDLSRHPELQWLLLSLVGVGKSQNHPWIAPPKRGSGRGTSRVDDLLRQRYPEAKMDDIDLLRQINTPEDIIELAESMGLADSDIKAIRQDLERDKEKGKKAGGSRAAPV